MSLGSSASSTPRLKKISSRNINFNFRQKANIADAGLRLPATFISDDRIQDYDLQHQLPKESFQNAQYAFRNHS